MPKRKGSLNSSDWRKWPRDIRERLYRQYLTEEATKRAQEIESLGWHGWYTEIFGTEFTSNLADHHAEAIDWHWNAMLLRRAGLKVTKPAYPAIWSRGHRKSDIIRHIVICEAALSKHSYCLYVSGTKAKVRGHAISVETLLAGEKLREYYPQLSEVKRNIQGAQKSWTADLMYAANSVFHFIGLTEGVAGANIDNVRPTLIVGDDIDDREDSPLISETRLKVFTRSVLPTMDHETTLFFLAQNYINRHGAVYRIHSGREKVLTNRVVTKPIPAVTNLITEEQTIDGIVQDVVVSGIPTWPYFDLDKVQHEINVIGLDAFKAECQHEVELDKTGIILPEYDESVHILKWSEFNGLYGLDADNRDVPRHWRKFSGWDWGSSPGHECAVSWLSMSAMNGPLPGTIFFYKLMSHPPAVLAGQVAHRILNYLLADIQANPRTYLELGLLDRATGDPSDKLATAVRTKVIDHIGQRTDLAMLHMSHEQKHVRDVCRMVYGLNYQACNPKRAGGIEQWRQYLRVDYTETHPFRPDKTGYTRFFFVVDDSEYDTPKTDAGLALARTQLPEWRWRPAQLTASGLLDERPLKQYDDVANSVMMITSHFNIRATPLSPQEQFQANIPPHLRYDALLANSPFKAGLTPEQELAHLMARVQARKAMKPTIQRFPED